MRQTPHLPKERLDSLVAEFRFAAERGALGSNFQGVHTDSRRSKHIAPELSFTQLDRLGRAVRTLQRGLTGERELAGASYMDDPELLGAYLLYYWPVSYVQASRALALSNLRPHRVLDIGSGPGPMAAAAVDSGACEVVALDRSVEALELASRLLGSSLKGRITADIESDQAFPGGPFDLAIFGHSLNELGVGDPERVLRRAAIVKKVALALSPRGAILVIDPATLATSRDTLALRNALLAEGWKALAPCTIQRPCPALAAGPSHTCHDQTPWVVPAVVRALAAKAGLDRELVKMSWIAMTPPSLESAPEHRGRYRVVSEPMLNKAGRVRYLLCGDGGRIPLSARRGDPAAERAGFFSLSRYDLIRVVNPQARPNGWGVEPGTIIEHLE